LKQLEAIENVWAPTPIGFLKDDRVQQRANEEDEGEDGLEYGSEDDDQDIADEDDLSLLDSEVSARNEIGGNEIHGFVNPVGLQAVPMEEMDVEMSIVD